MEQGSPTITSKWLFACDESGTKQTAYYGFGALILPWERRGDLRKGIRQLRRQHSFEHEAKWNRVNDRTLAFMYDLVDWFFRTKWLAFHCKVVRKADIDKARSDGSYELAWCKHFTGFIADKAARCVHHRPERHHWVRVWTDPIASSNAKADDIAHAIGKNMLRKKVGDQCELNGVLTHDSKETPAIQLCDVLLGSVVTSWLQTPGGQPKQDLRAWIARHLGWEDLRGATTVVQKKFNIWYFYDPTTGRREVWPRRVRLMYPADERPIARRLVAATAQMPAYDPSAR